MTIFVVIITEDLTQKKEREFLIYIFLQMQMPTPINRD